MNNGLHENPPFPGLNPEQIETEVNKFMDRTGLHDWKGYFIKGALFAQDPEVFEAERDDGIRLLPQEKEDLELEKTRKWTQAWSLWILVGFLALGAAIQGFDETAVNSGR